MSELSGVFFEHRDSGFSCLWSDVWFSPEGETGAKTGVVLVESDVIEFVGVLAVLFFNSLFGVDHTCGSEDSLSVGWIIGIGFGVEPFSDLLFFDLNGIRVFHFVVDISLRGIASSSIALRSCAKSRCLSPLRCCSLYSWRATFQIRVSCHPSRQ